MTVPGSWNEPAIRHASRIATTSACAVGIVVREYPVGALGHHVSVADHQRAEWAPVAARLPFVRQLDRPDQEPFVERWRVIAVGVSHGPHPRRIGPGGLPCGSGHPTRRCVMAVDDFPGG